MNTPNNKRRRESRKKIESVFVKLIQDKEINEISVTDICKNAEVNRTTFYANYIDIYDLADSVQKSLEEEVLGLYKDEWEAQESSHDFLRLFYHIKENPIFYKTYFKLNTEGKIRFVGYDLKAAIARFDMKHIDYHIAFFANGFNAVIKKWIENNCAESPEEIYDIIKDEYRGVKF